MRLPTVEARARFAAARVARLATASPAGVPHLVPITFAVLGAQAVGESAVADQVVFVVDDKPKTTTRLRRLDNIAAQPSVCLLVDVYDEDWRRLWWVRADGTATVHSPDSTPAVTAVDALAARYPAYVQRRPRGPVVAIEVAGWTGWAAADPTDTAAPRPVGGSG